MSRRLLTAAIIALSVAATAPLEARSLDSVRVSEQAMVPVIRPDWPVPAEPGQLFYVQRSTNSNTVVYTANFGADGLLDRRRPVSVYWRRYDTNGARKALKFVEDRFAYGVNARRGDQPGTFRITPRAFSRIPMLLYQTGPGRAEARIPIGGRLVRPVYAYVSIDEGGLIDRVVNVSVHGVDPDTGRAVSEIFRVTGGEIGQ